MQDSWLSSFLVIELGDSYVELVENYPCANKEELRRREGQLQRSLPCVNVKVAGRTAAEWWVETDYYGRH